MILKQISADELMDKFHKLTPVITEGIKHLLMKERKNKEERSEGLRFDLKYMMNFMKGGEDYVYDYDIEHIAESSLAYIQLLYDIHSKLFVHK